MEISRGTPGRETLSSKGERTVAACYLSFFKNGGEVAGCTRLDPNEANVTEGRHPRGRGSADAGFGISFPRLGSDISAACASLFFPPVQSNLFHGRLWFPHPVHTLIDNQYLGDTLEVYQRIFISGIPKALKD